MNNAIVFVYLILSLLCCSDILGERTFRDQIRPEANLAPNIPKSEFDALYALYNATDGENWSWPTDRNRTGLLPWERGVPWNFTAGANPCTDNWYGIICGVSVPIHVQSIILARQNLSGTIPGAIGHFPALRELELHNSPNLTGTIPDVFEAMTSLRRLQLDRNNLNGTLPSSLLAATSSLHSIVVLSNQLSGTFPTFLCGLSHLIELDLAFNNMHGTIPDCIGQLHRIQAIALSNNQLNGTIPPTMGNMSLLVGFVFGGNDFTGPMPESLTNISSLEYIDFSNTMMSGPISNAFCKMQQLDGLYIFNSHFTGTIPFCMTNMTYLKAFDANNNHLYGTIPENLLAKDHLQDFSISGSLIEDALPHTLTGSLQILQLGGNMLYGTIADSWFAIQKLQVLELYDNQLYGSLPRSIAASESLTTFELTGTALSGPIPSDIGNCSKLLSVLLGDNIMSGTLPRSISQLTKLQELIVEKNLFSGPLVGVVNRSVQLNLTTIVLNDNRLTGQIPDELFSLRSLTVFAAVSNCFSTPLTSAMCSSKSIVTLALDGLRSGRTCRSNLLLGLTSAYVVAHGLPQPIPSCIFRMQSLTTLHLSGNILTGSLPGNISISPTLKELSLSHNDLTGIIPENFQLKPWATLDLSFNRLTGSLLESFARDDRSDNVTSTYVGLSLENNRISGRVPRVLLKESRISILGSNLFDCNTQRSDLPGNDKGLKNYHCASKSFDVPYYIWLVLAFMCISICVLLVYANMCTWWWSHAKIRIGLAIAIVNDPNLVESLRSLRTVLELFRNIRVSTIVCICYILAVLVPFYVFAANQYGTYYHQYAWQVSAALLSGSIASVTIMGLLVVLLCVMLASVYLAVRRTKGRMEIVKEFRVSRPNSTSSIRTNATIILSWCERCMLYALFMMLSVFVVVGVNVAYVLVVLNKGTNTVVVVQIFLAFFKLFWNNFCSKSLLRWTGRQISKSVEATESVHGSEFHFVQLLVSLINNIAIPCVVVAVISPNCLYNVFIPPPLVKANYQYQSCAAYGEVLGFCLQKVTEVGETSYNPPFVYSYQCSSSIVTYYAPAFVFLCITATFVTPLSQFVMMHMARDERLPMFARKVLGYCVPKILKPLKPSASTVTLVIQSPYFDTNRAAILLFSFVGMLMTFGAVFPPLAVAFAVTIFSTTFFIKLKIGNFLGAAVEQKVTHLVDTLNAECEHLARISVLEPSVWLIVTFSCWFYTLFLFDTLGDAVGFRKAYWILIVMPLMPACLYLLYYIIVRFVEKRAEALEEPSVFVSETTVSPLGRHESSIAEVELTDIYSRPSESV